jgi:hypothetical protein
MKLSYERLSASFFPDQIVCTFAILKRIGIGVLFLGLSGRP